MFSRRNKRFEACDNVRMPFRVGSNVRFNVTTTPTQPQPQPVEPKPALDPRLVNVTTVESTYQPVKPPSTFDGLRGTVKRTGTDDDSLGGGAVLKQKGIYDVVNEGVVGRDTDPNRLALRDAIWDRLETPSYLREGAAPKPVDAKKLASALADNVSARQAASLTKKAQSSPQAGHHLVEFFSSTKALPKDVKASLLSTLSSDPAGVAGAVVANITGSKTFGAMSAADKANVATVLSRLDEKGLKTLGALFENVPEALADKDNAGGTLLSNLATLASQPLNASLTGHTTTDELLSSVLADVMNPNRVEQGTANTCTVASMQFELVADEPAEYARLMAGLTGPKGSVKMRAGGDLRLGPGDADERARDGRSVSQTIFQSAAMEYANGRFSNYDPVLGVSINERTGEERLGLRAENQQALLEKLFGVNYSINRLYSENEATNAFAKLVGWDARGNRNRPIVVDIDQGKFNHAVTLESVSKEKVVFRDPYGVLRSMPSEAFPKVAVAIHMPMDVKVNGVG
jgi:hypothetical protein